MPKDILASNAVPRFVAACLLVMVVLCGKAQAFEWVALGDLPYGDAAKVGPSYRALIERINRTKAVFSIHIGDFKSGSSACSDEEFGRQLLHFGLFDAPLIYTPGDNEWTDCHRASNGSHDPLERLSMLRSMFFPASRSLGRRPLAVQSQASEGPAQAKFVENLRWQHQDVLFATVHVVGSNNNFEVRDPHAVAEFFERDRANIAWIESTFEQARRVGAKALVFAMQGDPFELKSAWEDFPPHSGFRASLGQTLLPLAAAARIPILLVHGDSHVFRFDQPFRLGKEPIGNLSRLIVPGANDMRAVRIEVDTSAAHPWRISLLEP